MNVELTIQQLFDTYPSLFKERADALDHLFCTIGNGFFWHEGELILNEVPACEEILTNHLVDGKAYQHNKLSLRAESQMYEQERIANGWYDEWKELYPDEDIEEIKAIHQKTINELPDDIYYREAERRKRWGFYVKIPGNEHIDYHKNFAYLFNYPTNINPDWKDAIEECKTLLREDGYDV